MQDERGDHTGGTLHERNASASMRSKVAASETREPVGREPLGHGRSVVPAAVLFTTAAEAIFEFCRQRFLTLSCSVVGTSSLG
jgi:hypothetical protein